MQILAYSLQRHYAQDLHSWCDCHVSALRSWVLRRVPAKSLEMQEKSLYRNCCRDLALVVAARRLMSSRSTDAGWCFTSYTSLPTYAATENGLQSALQDHQWHLQLLERGARSFGIMLAYSATCMRAPSGTARAPEEYHIIKGSASAIMFEAL